MKPLLFLKLSLAAAVVAAPALLSPASAAPLAPQSTFIAAAGTDGEFVTRVARRHVHIHIHRGGYRGHYRGRCFNWRRECARRWGWGTPGSYRCLWRHAC